MKYLKDIGFVVKRVNLGESDRFVVIFTKDHGKIEVLAKGVRRITSRRASHTEPLNLIKFQTVKGSKNYILTEIEIVSRFEEKKQILYSSSSILKKNLEGISTAFLICELIDRLCPYGQRNEDIFNLILNTIERIACGDVKNAIYDFQVKMLILLGFWDSKREFKDEDDLMNFMENIIERKIKTKVFFKA